MPGPCLLQLLTSLLQQFSLGLLFWWLLLFYPLHFDSRLISTFFFCSKLCILSRNCWYVHYPWFRMLHTMLQKYWQARVILPHQLHHRFKGQLVQRWSHVYIPAGGIPYSQPAFAQLPAVISASPNLETQAVVSSLPYVNNLVCIASILEKILMLSSYHKWSQTSNTLWRLWPPNL